MLCRDEMYTYRRFIWKIISRHGLKAKFCRFLHVFERLFNSLTLAVAPL